MRIKNYDVLTSHGNTIGRKIVADIIEAGLSGGNPYSNTLKLVSIKDNQLIFDRKDMEPVGDPRSGPAVYALDKVDRIFVFALGKGILYIVKALEDVLGDHLTGGFALGKHGDLTITSKVEVAFGSHPVPDIHGIKACQRMLDIASELRLTENDLVITAMGNGSSALACLPAEGITIDDIRAMNQLCLIDTGMPTSDVSYIRNQTDRFRGGRVLRAFRPAKIVNLFGIGPPGTLNPMFTTPYESFTKTNFWLPNAPDATTSTEAIAIADKWNVFERLPKSIREHLLANKDRNDTLGWEEYETFNCRIFGVMPRTMSAFAAARAKAEEMGLKTYHLNSTTNSEAAPTGTYVAGLASHSVNNGTPFMPPCVLFEGGELIVTVNEETGIGGTNQEFCTAAALVLDGNKRIVIGAVDTDGTDGPGGDFHHEATALGINCLTGGIVDGYTASEAREKGVNLFRAMKTHDTSNALWQVGSGVAAVQNISVGDLHCILLMGEDG